MRKMGLLLAVAMIFALVTLGGECDGTTARPAATSGVTKATAKVKTQASGLTVEQENVKRRLEEDNKPGSIKHLYVISAYSGDVIMYSTVKGKVTSGGKRLTPTTVAAIDGDYVGSQHFGEAVNIGGTTRRTGEVLQDDGTYGKSMDYLYWWDVQGRFHQHYVSGGQIVHVSSQPLAVNKIIINVETHVREK